MTTVTIEAGDIREVRQALHNELGSAAEALHRAADDYALLDEGEQPASSELCDARARVEKVLWLLDAVGMGYSDGAPATVGDGHFDLLVEALAHRAHAMRDELSDEFGMSYDERNGPARVLSLMGRYRRIQALLAVLRDRTAVPA